MSDWKNKEPTTALVDQLRRVAEYDEGDQALLAKAVEHAGTVLGELEAFGFPRPFVYPDIDDDGVVAEWPSDWNVSLHICPDGSMRVHACTLVPDGEMRCADFAPGTHWAGVADFLDPLLPFKPIGSGRLAELLR